MMRLSAQPIRHRLLIAATQRQPSSCCCSSASNTDLGFSLPKQRFDNSHPQRVPLVLLRGTSLSFLSSINPTLCPRCAFKTIRAVI